MKGRQLNFGLLKQSGLSRIFLVGNLTVKTFPFQDLDFGFFKGRAHEAFDNIHIGRAFQFKGHGRSLAAD
jgi:hypothetical protein